MSYQPLDKSELTFRQIKQIKDLNVKIKNGALCHLQSDTVTLGQQHLISLGKIVSSLGGEMNKQYPVDPKRVKQILFGDNHPVVTLGYFIEDIVIGVLESDWIDNNKSLEDVYVHQVSGRHRTVSYLTICKFSDIDEKDYLKAKIRVAVKIFKSQKVMAEAIVAANSNRHMSKSEQVNMIFTSLDANTFEEIANTYGNATNESAKSARLAFSDGLLQCLNLHQKATRAFKVSDKILLEGTLRTISRKYMAKVSLLKGEQTPETLLKIVDAVIKDLPDILESLPLEVNERAGSFKYAERVAIKMREIIYH
jgi:hypothetical protein